jgi:hypothetical protein
MDFLTFDEALFRNCVEHTRTLGEDVAQSASTAPSHDGQFARQVKSLANEAQAQMSVLADRLAALAEVPK